MLIVRAVYLQARRDRLTNNTNACGAYCECRNNLVYKIDIGVKLFNESHDEQVT